MLNIDTTTSVFVSVAIGYAANRLIKKILETGPTVHANGRDPPIIVHRQYSDAITV